MTDQTNTPELRFPEFKKEWQCYKWKQFNKWKNSF